MAVTNLYERDYLGRGSALKDEIARLEAAGGTVNVWGNSSFAPIYTTPQPSFETAAKAVKPVSTSGDQVEVNADADEALTASKRVKVEGVTAGETAQPAAADEATPRLEPDEVAQIAQGLLTALNVGNIQSGSPLHLKLRKTMIAHRMRRQEITPERWEELQVALDRDGGPTEAEAEEVLRYFGTSGKKVTNQLIERLMRENLELRAQSAAVDALCDAAFFARNRLLQDSGDQESIDKLNAALAAVEGKGEADGE